MKKYVSSNPYSKQTETVEWLDWECTAVHEYNEELRAAGIIR